MLVIGQKTLYSCNIGAEAGPLCSDEFALYVGPDLDSGFKEIGLLSPKTLVLKEMLR